VAVAGPVRLRYGVKGQARGLHYSASAELLWLPAGSQYEARLEVSAFLLGSRVQTSSGQLTPAGLAPTRFSDKSRAEQAAHFERAKGRISFSGNTPDVALLPGAQDRLSVVLQLAALLAATRPAIRRARRSRSRPPGRVTPTYGPSPWRGKNGWNCPVAPRLAPSWCARRATNSTRKWNFGFLKVTIFCQYASN